MGRRGKTMDLETWKEIQAKLAQPFDTVDFLPRGGGNSGQALALPYIDARDIMRRLDEVVGPEWAFDYDLLSDDGKMVRGRLTVCGITRCDAGQANAEDERLKSAVSDALKRAAVHFGIGRYLYYLPPTWAPYDAQKRRFTAQPQIKPADLQRAVETVLGSSLGRVRQVPTAPVAESRGDARAQQAVTRAERPAPQVEARPDAAEAELAALKAECKRLHIQLVGTDEQESRSADYRVRLGLPPGTALSPAEWAKLRALLVELTTDPFEVPDAGSVPSDDGNPVPGAFR